jgi:UDP-N-acetylmuramate dehydrogenase
MTIQKNISLKNLNTFKIDAYCDYFARVSNNDDFHELTATSEFLRSKKIILGGGSNMLFTKNFDGMVIKNEYAGINIIGEDEDVVFVKAGGGVVWDDLVSFSVRKNLGGIENLALIPGTAGAAPVQNIGAYGQELKDSFFSLEALNLETGNEIFLKKADCKFGYRTSIFKNELKNKTIVTHIILRLKKNPIPDVTYGGLKRELNYTDRSTYTIAEISDAIRKIREQKLPDPAVIGSAGSFFKNPEIKELQYLKLKEIFSDMPGYKTESGLVKIPAGWLIEQTGWKGKEIGNVATYSKQALVIINKGSATGSEVLEFSEKIKRSVIEKYGIALEKEVNIF